MPFLLPEGAEYELQPDAVVQNEPVQRSKSRTPNAANAALQEAAAETLAGAALSTTLLPCDLPRPAVNEREDAAAWHPVPASAPHTAPVRAPAAAESEPVLTEAVHPSQAAYFRDAGFALLGIMNPDGSISVIEPVAGPLPEPSAPGGEGT